MELWKIIGYIIIYLCYSVAAIGLIDMIKNLPKLKTMTPEYERNKSKIATIKEYSAIFNIFEEAEKIVIVKCSDGKFYIHYGWTEKSRRGSVIDGGYNSFEKAEKILLKNRPTAKRV